LILLTLILCFNIYRISLTIFDIALQLWDFGGQNRFRFLLKKYVKGASGALLLFDLSNPVSIESADD